MVPLLVHTVAIKQSPQSHMRHTHRMRRLAFPCPVQSPRAHSCAHTCAALCWVRKVCWLASCIAMTLGAVLVIRRAPQLDPKLLCTLLLATWRSPRVRHILGTKRGWQPEGGASKGRWTAAKQPMRAGAARQRAARARTRARQVPATARAGPDLNCPSITDHDSVSPALRAQRCGLQIICVSPWGLPAPCRPSSRARGTPMTTTACWWTSPTAPMRSATKSRRAASARCGPRCATT